MLTELRYRVQLLYCRFDSRAYCPVNLGSPDLILDIHYFTGHSFVVSFFRMHNFLSILSVTFALSVVMSPTARET